MSSIINCVAYEKGVALPPFPLDDVSEIITRPGVFLWVGLLEPDETLLLKIQEEFGMHELVMEDARSPQQRTKLEAYGESLFLVAKTASITDDGVIFGETHLFVGKNFLITLRHGTSRGYSEVRQRCEKNPQRLALGSGYALYAILDSIADSYLLVLGELRNQFQQLEEEMFDNALPREKLQRIYQLKRELIQLRDATQPLIDICNELRRFHEDIIPKTMRVYLRDVQDHCHRVIEACDNIREMLIAAMQINLALVSIGQNDIVKKLAGWGAILALPTVVFSMYGMNFKFMPELDWHWGYFGVLGCTFAVGSVLFFKFRRSGWL
ncbi:Mg2+/Co2+ transport protein [gamma proteobacterium HdN1]|nr:Mg2+/Co2+ transport protein [gamma proteobacterium HdN1]